MTFSGPTSNHQKVRSGQGLSDRLTQQLIERKEGRKEGRGMGWENQ